MNFLKDIIYVSIILLLLLIAIGSFRRNAQNESLLISANDTLQLTRNEFGQQTATISALEGSISALVKLNAGKDSTIGKLKKIVDKKTITATILSNATENTVINETTIIHSVDTVFKDSIAYVFPVYKTAFENRWENFNATAGKDSFEIHYKVFNEFEIKHQWQRKNIFSKKYAEISVLNLNPHTETKELKTFIVQQPRQNKFIVFIAGFATGFLLFTVIQK